MAKIKTRNSDSHKTKPKGVNKRSFEQVYWPYIPIVIAITLLITLGSTGGGIKAALRHPLGRVLSYSSSMSIGGLLADTNAQRTSNGVGTLSLNSQLDAAAQAKADDMAARNYWSHNTPEGNPPWIFVNAQGYSYQKLGENLATGFSDEQAAINGWMASPPHRENLLDANFTEVGFGYANNPDYTAAGGGPMTIVVAFYGKPTAPAPVASTAPPASTPKQSSAVNGAETQNQAPAAAAPTSDTPTADAVSPTPTKTPVTTKKATNTDNAVPASAVTTSHLQLAAPSGFLGPWAAKLSVFLAFIIILLWANRHIRALHKFLLKGERYAIRHPLTDIGIVVIACLLFILSQTAGLIQ